MKVTFLNWGGGKDYNLKHTTTKRIFYRLNANLIQSFRKRGYNNHVLTPLRALKHTPPTLFGKRSDRRKVPRPLPIVTKYFPFKDNINKIIKGIWKEIYDDPTLPYDLPSPPFDKLSQSMHQLQNLVTEEEWREKQQTHTEFEDSLTNKQDKFSDKLTNKRAKKLEKLQNPGVNSRPSRNLRNERTRNTNNKGNKSHKRSEGRKQKPSAGNKNNRKGKQKAQRQDNHQQGRPEHTSRAGADQTALTTYPSTQPTPTYHPSYYPSPIPAWPHPYMMPQMAPWAPGFLPTLGAPRPPEK